MLASPVAASKLTVCAIVATAVALAIMGVPALALAGHSTPRQCPAFFDGFETCYAPGQLPRLMLSPTLRPIDPGYRVWRVTRLRLRAVAVLREGNVSSGPGPVQAIFFVSGRLPRAAAAPVQYPRPFPDRPKFVMVEERLGRAPIHGIAVNRPHGTVDGVPWHGSWRLHANFRSDRVHFTAETNYDLKTLWRIGRAILRAHPTR